MSHLIRFYSGEGKPTMLSWHDGKSVPFELEGAEDIDFSHKRACIGYRTPDGYRACSNQAINIRQCPRCANLDMAKAYTVGDFSGYPELYKEAKEEEYCLYLAGFGEEIIKCGVTRKERFELRMREQGADFGAIVASFAGPDEIYQHEHSLQARFQFNNAVRLAQKMRLLSFDRMSAKNNFQASVELVKSSGVLPDFEISIRDFSECYPKIHSFQETTSVLGEVIGAKGEILLFKSESGKTFAVNMRQLVGSFFERKK